MGMYTELIFGAELKTETPKKVIDTIKYLLDEIDMDDPLFPKHNSPFNRASFYFGVSSPFSRFYFDSISQAWILSTRSNLKNYGGEIELFLNWISPYISNGSGTRDMYAIVTYEEGEPVIHSLY